MPRASRFRVVAAAALLFAAPAARAARAPDWVLRARGTTVAPALLEARPAPDAVALWSQRIVTAAAGSGSTRLYEREAIRILTAAGTSEGTFTAHYDDDSKVSVEGAWTLHADGTAEELDLDDAVTVQLAHPEYFTDEHQMAFRPPRLAPGEIAAYALSRKSRRDVYQWLVPLQRTIPVAAQEVAIDLPDGWRHSWRLSRVPEGYAGALSGEGGAKASYPFGPQRGLPSEDAAPPSVDLAATMEISVLPPAGEFSQFAFRSWNDVAAWFQRKSLPARRDAGTDPVAAGADPRLAAATWVQEKIRYVAVEVGEGGYVPREPALVTRRLYGDCKDKSFLLLALLGKRGIEAFPVLTRARSAGWIDPEFPSPIQFNHLILAVRVPAKTGLPAEIMLSDGPAVLFDATDAWTPWGRIPGELQGSRGLVVRANGGELMDFPFAPPTVNRMERVVEGSLSETGSLTAEVVEKTDGALGERALYQSWTPQQRTDVFAGYAADHVTGSRASDVSFSHLEERSTPMEARFKISAPGFLRRTGGLVLLPVTPFSVAPDRVLRGGERRSPINLGVPARYELKTRLKLPYGHVSDGLPDPVEAENAWALYRLVVTEEAGHILARELYEVRKPLVPTSELAAWKSFEAAVAKGSGARAVIMTKPAS